MYNINKEQFKINYLNKKKNNEMIEAALIKVTKGLIRIGLPIYI